MNTKLRKLILASAVVLAAGTSGVASAVDAFILPTPDNNTNVTLGLYPDAQGNLREAYLLNGIPIAFKYDSSGLIPGRCWSQSRRIPPR